MIWNLFPYQNFLSFSVSKVVQLLCLDIVIGIDVYHNIHKLSTDAAWLYSHSIPIWTVNILFFLYKKIFFWKIELTKFHLNSTFSYDALSRVVWSIALCYIIFACIHKKGGPINSILAHPLWQPLSRICYSIYLMHFFVIRMTMASTKSPFYFSELNAVSCFLHFDWIFHLITYFFICSSTHSLGILFLLYLYHWSEHSHSNLHWS